MSDSIFILGPDRLVTEARSTTYDLEADLQELLADNVELLPGAQINPSNPRKWLLVKREAGIPNHEGGAAFWSIDHLLVDQDAVPTFVEVKRASDSRTRREVVAQMLDYAANGSLFWTPERLREWFEDSEPESGTDRLVRWLDPSAEEPESVADAFWRAVGTNLREGRVRLIFVADEIPASLQRLVEFLNEQMPRIEVLAVEIRQYLAAGSKSGALVPRLIGQTARAQATKEPSASAPRRSKPWTIDDVTVSVAQAGESERAAAAVVFNWVRGRADLFKITGGTGLSYPSVTVSVDSGRSASRFRPVLALYGSPHGGRPMLEVRVARMCRTPPYERDEFQQPLLAQLEEVGFGHLEAEEIRTTDRRPNIPLNKLTDENLAVLLAAANKWIDDVRVHAGEPETGDDSYDAMTEERESGMTEP
jgi:hypothetical protein